MSSDAPPEPAPGSLAAISLSIFSDLLANLTHDLVLQAHRAEKLLRTQQQQHLAHLAATAAVNGSSSQPPEDTSAPRMPPGNPLATVPDEILCPRCHLPRHTPETMNQGTITLENGEKKKFCQKLPFQNMRGHDIYGNPFPNPNATAGTKKGKKEAAAAAAAAAATNGDSPGASTPLTNGDGDVPLKPGKNSGIVYFKCTSCDNEKVASSRYAAHLEKCLGLSGRKSSRAAMAKMNNSGTGSPMLAAVAESSSRKPSPEKNPTPVPLPPPPQTADIAPPETVTPKKKKKSAAAAAAAAANAASAAATSAPTAAAPTDAPTDPSTTTTSGPPKKRKRKLEEGGAEPKKLKIAPDTPKKLKPGNAAPAGNAPSPSPEVTTKKIKKKTIAKPAVDSTGTPVPKVKKANIGRPPKAQISGKMPPAVARKTVGGTNGGSSGSG